MVRKRCCFDVDCDVDEQFKLLCNEKGRKKSRFLELLMRLAIDQYNGILQLAQHELSEECSPEETQDHQQQSNS